MDKVLEPYEILKKRADSLSINNSAIGKATNLGRSVIARFFHGEGCSLTTIVLVSKLLNMEVLYAREDDTPCVDIRTECKRLGITKAELSHNTALSIETIQKVFKDDKSVRFNSIKPILKYLNLHLVIQPKKYERIYHSKNDFIKNVSKHDVYRQFAREGYDECQRQLKYRVKNWLEEELNGYNLSCKDYKALMVSFNSLFKLKE